MTTVSLLAAAEIFAYATSSTRSSWSRRAEEVALRVHEIDVSSHASAVHATSRMHAATDVADSAEITRTAAITCQKRAMRGGAAAERKGAIADLCEGRKK